MAVEVVGILAKTVLAPAFFAMGDIFNGAVAAVIGIVFGG